ncbi:hypothetical protein RRG08_026226 [Elysia crispata]|uniref:Uncharacterized protein n=1 Tax=Elysia crispata TaxID=231223 RepID=A0AAE0ZAK1_9GAST|nr:hypothetical protein RRG08_026226 [Elysia crispata]
MGINFQIIDKDSDSQKLAPIDSQCTGQESMGTRDLNDATELAEWVASGSAHPTSGASRIGTISVEQMSRETITRLYLVGCVTKR